MVILITRGQIWPRLTWQHWHFYSDMHAHIFKALLWFLYETNRLYRFLFPGCSFFSYFLWAQFHHLSTGSFFVRKFCAKPFCAWSKGSTFYLRKNIGANVGEIDSSSLTPILLAHSLERKSCAYFLAMRTRKVGRIFVGETEWHLTAQKNAYWRICALDHKVGEIDPWFIFCLFSVWTCFLLVTMILQTKLVMQ